MQKQLEAGTEVVPLQAWLSGKKFAFEECLVSILGMGSERQVGPFTGLLKGNKLLPMQGQLLSRGLSPDLWI